MDETSKAVLASFVEGKTLDPSRFPEDEEVIKESWHRGAKSLWSFLQRKQVGDLTGDIKG